MQNEPVDTKAPQAAALGRSATTGEVRDRLEARLGVELAVVDGACDEASLQGVPTRSVRIRQVRDRLAARLGVEPAVVDGACQDAEDRAAGPRRALLISALADNQRQLNRLHGEQAELHAQALEMGLRGDELAGTSSPALEVRSLAGEIGAVSGRSQRSVQIELGRAYAIAKVFEPVQGALEAGAISRAHALVIVDAGLRIAHPDPVELERRREEFCRVVLEKAGSTTPGRVKALAERAAEELTEESLDERFERARRTRRVTLAQLEDGLGELSIVDSYAKLRLVFDRTTRQARVISDAERRAAKERADSDRAADSGHAAGSDHAADSGHAADSLEAEAEAGDPAGQLAGSQLSTGDLQDGTAGAGAETRADAADPNEGPLPEPRSLDEVRADVLSDSFLRATPEELKGRDPVEAKIAFVVPVETYLAPAAPPHRDAPLGAPPDLTGVADSPPPRGASAPALLDGYIPVPTAEVRRLINAAPEFERIFTDPIKGTLVEVDSYRPTSAMRRRLAVRDGRCRFVGCMMPANRCEIDHTKAWEEGGPTSLPNLGHLCKGDHTGKHHGDWALQQLTDGTYEWSSPTGLLFRDEPVQFGRLTTLPPPLPAADAHTVDPPDARTPREPDVPADPEIPANPDDPPRPPRPGEPGDTASTANPGELGAPHDPHGTGDTDASRDTGPSRAPGDAGDAGDEDRRQRFPKIGFLEEFRRERAAKKAAIDAADSRTRQPEFRPTVQQGEPGGLARNPPEGEVGTGDRVGQEGPESSPDPPPF
ncbi:HNH endonuclease signature motif containing protein [Pseudoclavibacter sp. RFBA6]|uniref:HNH endonuclease signature motif containing protein n=1 Tax=Pseudoclavibacter sp. RFBA6 TaxID=2080573 RepID=UPI0011B0665E|nr:HNH endonuclease signature motif containing protein [Pseudoclavibacter sp. RFBA6]